MKLRFTIRDLFWLTLVVALAVGWWLWWRNVVYVDDGSNRTPIGSNSSENKVMTAISQHAVYGHLLPAAHELVDEHTDKTKAQLACHRRRNGSAGEETGR